MAAKNKYRSVNLTRFYMKIVGFWIADTKREQIMMNVALVYAVIAIVFGIYVELVDLYNCRHEFYAVTYNLASTMLLLMILIKFSSFIFHRDLVMNIIKYAEQNFWSIEYNEYGNQVLTECDSKGVMLTYTFTLIVQMGTCNYIFAPLIENRGRNETDRLLPFKLWVDLPLTTTPYYEVTYTIQSLSTIHVGLCTFCFDNFLCCFNIHVAAQFKILARKVEIIADTCLTALQKNSGDGEEAGLKANNEFETCIQEHRALIKYVQCMEHAFTWILLGQLILSSMIICIGGFQILATKSAVRKCIFVLIFVGSMTQLFLYTWTCNDIILQSQGVAEAAYNMQWYDIPHDKTGKMIKYGVIMIITRTRKPCVLTAGNFVPMSLETFTSILSTAGSYFTLLQQMYDDDIAE